MMIKRMYYFIKKDIRNSFKDSAVLIYVLFPIIIAIVLKLIIPGIESANITFVIDETSVNKQIIDTLDEYGYIETYNGVDKVKKRINDFDDVTGLIKENGEYKVIYEGNESENYTEITGVVLNRVLLSTEEVTIKLENLNITKSFIFEYIAIIVVVLCILFTSIMGAFNIVDEKEHNTVKALGVTPLNLMEYIISRAIIMLVFSTIITFICVIIMFGFNINYLNMFLAIIFSLGIGVLFSFIVGGFAKSEIEALGLMKMTGWLVSGIPIGAIFIPASWQWTLYIFPNYWMFNTIKNIFIGPQEVGFLLSGIITLASSIIFIIILMKFVGKQLKLR